MANEAEKNLTKKDALDKIYDDIREMIDKFFPDGYGRLWFPRQDNPIIMLEIDNYRVKFGILKLPNQKGAEDAEVKYKAD